MSAALCALKSYRPKLNTTGTCANTFPGRGTYLSMDLGLQQEEGPPRQRRAVGRTAADDQLKQLVTVIAKLSLSNALRIRCLQSIVLQVLKVPTETQYIKAGMEATAQWTQQAKGLSQEPKEDTIGIPHVHLFNALIKVLKERKADHQPTQQAITDYVTQMQSGGWRAAHAQIPYCRIQRNYDKEFKRLEWNANAGTPSANIMALIVEDLKTVKGTKQLPGIPPAGDLERKIQTWLDEHGRAE